MHERFDPLIRTRAQLMVEKKDEKKADNKAAAATPDTKSDGDIFPPADSNSQ